MSHRTPVLRLARLATCAVWLLIATGSLAACAASGDEPPAKEEIERAKEEGRQQARAEERTKAAAAQTERLREEIEQLQEDGGSSSDGSPRTPPSPTSARAATPCGGGLSVNSVTTCPFARNVRDAYERSGGARVIDVYSPVTKRGYTMRCADGVPTICRGGNGAIVYIR